MTGTAQCNKLWSYKEVRRLADLDTEEMQYFEENMARLAVAEYCEVQSVSSLKFIFILFKTKSSEPKHSWRSSTFQCPRCKTNVERKNLSSLCVQCVVCTADLKKSYQFCWQCDKPWKSPGARSGRCGNDGCVNKDLQILQTCKTIGLCDVQGVDSCPSVRACPVCGLKVEHNQKRCKNVVCPRCKEEFCFVCLKLKRVCCQTSSPFRICPGGVAPRQTSVPVWKKK